MSGAIPFFSSPRLPNMGRERACRTGQYFLFLFCFFPASFVSIFFFFSFSSFVWFVVMEEGGEKRRRAKERRACLVGAWEREEEKEGRERGEDNTQSKEGADSPSSSLL